MARTRVERRARVPRADQYPASVRALLGILEPDMETLRTAGGKA